MHTPFFVNMLFTLFHTSNRAQRNVIERRETPATGRLGLRLWHVNTAHHHETKRETTILRGTLATFAQAQRHICMAMLLLVLFLGCSIQRSGAHRSALSTPESHTLSCSALFHFHLFSTLSFASQHAVLYSMM